MVPVPFFPSRFIARFTQLQSCYHEAAYCSGPQRKKQYLLMKSVFRISILLLLTIFNEKPSKAQHSIARDWNEVALQSIREDFARPTVHARNLFHLSAAMWDAWSAYEFDAEPYFLGNSVSGFSCQFDGIPIPENTELARQKSISYAAYRILSHRFKYSPGASEALARYDSLMAKDGYDTAINSVDYTSGSPEALGNHIAECVIAYGFQDGANEDILYLNRFYTPSNPPLVPALPGNPHIINMNRWQPLSFDIFVDQAGHQVPGGIPDFVGAEWGAVSPFSLKPTDATIKERDGNQYWIYFDPGPPPYLDDNGGLGIDDEYKCNFALVAIWSSHLDPTDGTAWDISPASLGNLSIETLPDDIPTLRDFYDLFNGGDPGKGHLMNPATGQPYWGQLVPRGDYARVLAEFWADGPDSETPPGHWFTILNYVTDHPSLEKRFNGVGPILNDLEWDIKSYFALGGAMHDSAIASWGVKGWYDYIRPISAIRGMAEFGQSSDPSLPRFHQSGIPLVPGYIELVAEADPLSGGSNENLNEIKILAWRGPNSVFDPEQDEGGVDWVLAADWWPYQRPSFVTPPFAGYVSGHSTFSRAAAEVLTMLTGDPFFPGGMGEFVARKNAFLVFEDGPSEDVVLQWATYRDASDQTSLSRIWGGIHPPADDIPGRLMGETIGKQAFAFAERFFSGRATDVQDPIQPTSRLSLKVFPNPVRQESVISLMGLGEGTLSIIDVTGRLITNALPATDSYQLPTGLAPGLYLILFQSQGSNHTGTFVVLP